MYIIFIHNMKVMLGVIKWPLLTRSNKMDLNVWNTFCWFFKSAVKNIDNQLYLCPPLFQRRFYQDFPEYKSLASRLSLEDTVAFHMIRIWDL